MAKNEDKKKKSDDCYWKLDIDRHDNTLCLFYINILKQCLCYIDIDIVFILHRHDVTLYLFYMLLFDQISTLESNLAMIFK